MVGGHGLAMDWGATMAPGWQARNAEAFAALVVEEERDRQRRFRHRTWTERVRHWFGWRDGVRLCDGACGRAGYLDDEGWAR